MYGVPKVTVLLGLVLFLPGCGPTSFLSGRESAAEAVASLFASGSHAGAASGSSEIAATRAFNGYYQAILAGRWDTCRSYFHSSVPADNERWWRPWVQMHPLFGRGRQPVTNMMVQQAEVRVAGREGYVVTLVLCFVGNGRIGLVSDLWVHTETGWQVVPEGVWQPGIAPRLPNAGDSQSSD